MAIKRIWHGWTTPENAPAYRELLRREVFPALESKRIPGYRSIELLTRDLGDEVEFVTIMTFESMESLVAFRGPDSTRSYVPDAAKALLKRWDERATHFETVETREYPVDILKGS